MSPERALKKIRPQALRQLHHEGETRKLKTAVEIRWQALEWLDNIQRAALNAWLDGELQKGKIKRTKSRRYLQLK